MIWIAVMFVRASLPFECVGRRTIPPASSSSRRCCIEYPQDPRRCHLWCIMEVLKVCPYEYDNHSCNKYRRFRNEQQQQRLRLQKSYVWLEFQFKRKHSSAGKDSVRRKNKSKRISAPQSRVADMRTHAQQTHSITYQTEHVLCICSLSNIMVRISDIIYCWAWCLAAHIRIFFLLSLFCSKPYIRSLKKKISSPISLLEIWSHLFLWLCQQLLPI